MKVLITSGGTKIPIDAVRDITNMSKGTFGTKIAETFLRHGHEVIFIRAKDSKSPMRLTVDVHENGDVPFSGFTAFCAAFHEERDRWRSRYHEHQFKTFEQYERVLQFAITGDKPDVIVLAAAVSDYGVEKPFAGKYRSNDLLTIRLESLPKIINKIKGWAPDAKLVGFKLLVGSTKSDLVLASKKSCEENGCDMVVANDLEDIKFNKHKVLLVFPTNSYVICESDPKDPDFLAKKVVEYIEQL